MTKSRKKVCISFVCQAGELEIKAILLAASLRSHLENFDGELVAAVPEENTWGRIAPQTREIFSHLGVRLQSIVSPFGKDYPIGNKMAALGVDVDADHTLFLDSDMLCLAPLDVRELSSHDFMAKPADLSGVATKLDNWARAYQLLGLELGAMRTRCTTDHRLVPPYFNAGAVSVKDGPEFARVWLDSARRLDADAGVTDKRPWLDQIALPITVRRLGLRFNTFSEKFNFPGHIKALPVSRPVLWHYHWPKIIANEQIGRDAVGESIERFPDLANLMDHHQEWRALRQLLVARQTRLHPKGHKGEAPLEAKPEQAAVSEAGSQRTSRGGYQDAKEAGSTDIEIPTGGLSRDFLLSGMPRSGTSLLAKLLNQAPDAVVINEPIEIFKALAPGSEPEKFGLYYREVRSAVSCARPVPNKVDIDGSLVEDTIHGDVRREHLHEVAGTGFKLGTKNPLAYMSRLRFLCDHYPDMPKVVTLRHPWDTIASWKRSFEHLEQVDLSRFPSSWTPAGADDRFQSEALKELSAQNSLPIRRALLWNYLAALIWRERHRCLLVRYEDLTTQTSESLRNVQHHLGIKGVPQAGIDAVAYRRNLSCLDAADYEAVACICTEQMALFGY